MNTQNDENQADQLTRKMAQGDPDLIMLIKSARQHFTNTGVTFSMQERLNGKFDQGLINLINDGLTGKQFLCEAEKACKRMFLQAVIEAIISDAASK